VLRRPAASRFRSLFRDLYDSLNRVLELVDLLDTTLSFVVFGLGLLLVSILGFVIYFRRKRWM